MDCNDSSKPWKAFEIATVCPRHERTANTTAAGVLYIAHAVATCDADVYYQAQAGVRSGLSAATAPLSVWHITSRCLSTVSLSSSAVDTTGSGSAALRPKGREGCAAGEAQLRLWQLLFASLGACRQRPAGAAAGRHVG